MLIKSSSSGLAQLKSFGNVRAGYRGVCMNRLSFSTGFSAVMCSLSERRPIGSIYSPSDVGLLTSVAGSRMKQAVYHLRRYCSRIYNFVKSIIMMRCWPLNRPQVIETRAFPRIVCELIKAKAHVKIHFVQYLNVK